MLYFAYGSNLDPRQMAKRCPDSSFVMTAHLDEHRLHFPLRSPVRRCAVASIAPAAGHRVWGALYRMTPGDFAELDMREGYHPGDADRISRYTRSQVSVIAADHGRVAAAVYVATSAGSAGLPSLDYLEHLIRGAVHWRFPEDYVAMLRRLPTTAAA